MREPLSNHHLTRCLLAFLVALIVPNGVWGQTTTTYDLYVAGTQVTSDNASDVFPLDETNTGKVSFDAETSTLTLNGVNITVLETVTTGAIVSNLSNLTIQLVGTNLITCQANTCYAFYSTNSSNTISFTTNNASASLTLVCNKTDGIAQIYNNVTLNYNNIFEIYEDGDNSTIKPIEYGISIGNTAISILNYSDVLGDGTVSYDNSTNTLSLKGATLTSMISIDYTKETLNLDLSGKNSISTTDSECIMAEVCAITVTSSDETGSLSLQTTKEESGYDSNVSAGCTFTITSPLSTSGDITSESTTITSVRIYIPQAGTISYATTSVRKTYGSDAFTNELTKTGDGTVTYTSSDTNVATINASTGEVTIANVGTTTITATVTNGENYNYATTTATYTLTVSYFSAGSGTVDDPYIISTADDLKRLNNIYNGTLETYPVYYFQLSDNIDCSDLSGFVTIGTTSSPYCAFNGVFDGNGKTISNLTSSSEGLFYNISGGTVKNLTLSNCSFAGRSGNVSIGALAVNISGSSTIQNCTVTGCTLSCYSTAYNPNVAGLAAIVSSATITDCTVTNTTINAISTYTGGSGAQSIAAGLVGKFSGGTVSGCTVTGTTTIKNYYYDNATMYTGALIGYNNSGTLSGNNYEYSVNTEVQTTSGGTVTTKSGYDERGTQNGDITTNDGAVLYTKAVTVPNETEEGTFMGYESYEIYDDTNVHFAPGQTARLTVIPGNGYAIASAPTITYGSESITSVYEVGIQADYPVYSFTMPDADATASVTFAKDLSYEGYNYVISSPTYTGSAIIPESITMNDVDGEFIATLTKDEDYTISGYKDDTDKEVSSVINAGDYKVTIIGKGNYTGTKEDIKFTVEQASASITATNQSTTYSGSAVEYSTNNITTDPVSVKVNIRIAYYTTDPSATQTITTEALEEAPSEAGTYYVKATLENENYIAEPKVATLTIEKAEPTVTAPTAKTDLAYTGDSLVLITAGATEHGTLYYAVGSEGTYKTALAKAKEAGTYYVYYKIVGDTNHKDSIFSKTPVEVTISKTAISPAVTIANWTYGTTASTPVVTGNTGEGIVTYTYKVKDAGNDTYSETVPTDAGDYTIKAEIAESTNFNSATATADFTISKAEPTVTAPTAITELTYNGAEQVLINAGETSDGTIQYGIDNANYSADLPKGTDAKTYNVYYKVIGDTNHKDSVYTKNPIAVTIAQANMTDVIIAIVAEQTYTGAAIEPEPALTLGTGETAYTLVKGTDFTYSYANNTNVPTSSGQQETPPQPTITMTAVAEGNFTGTATKTFSITAKSITAETITIADIPDRVYKTDTITPKVIIKDGDVLLKEFQDYTLSYADNDKVGEATVNIEGCGNYTDTTNKKFKITAAASSVETAPEAIADLTYVEDALALIEPGTAKNGTMQYVLGTDATTAPTEGYTEDTPTGTDAGTYYVWYKVVAVNSNYSDTEPAVITATISKADPDFTEVPEIISGLVYSGATQTLITAGEVIGGEIQYSTDGKNYSTTIPTGTNAGTYNIYYKVVGATNYNDIPASEVPLEVKIAQANIANVIIANIDDKTYTGEAYQPEVTVTFNDLTVPAEEYTVSYSNNTEAGEATVTLTSSNVNFAEGTKTANFTITKAAGSISYEITNVSKIVGDETFTNVLTSEGDGTVTYASNNTQVATVDAETGNVTIVGAGTATITATVTDGKNYTYEVKEATYTLTVGYQLDLKFAEGQTWATYYSKDNFLTVPDGLNAYVVTNISETTVSVTQIDYIPKEEPVLLELTDNTASTFVAQVYTGGIAQFNNLLQAGTTDIAVSTFETNVYVLYNNEFRRATSGSIPAYKGYLTTEAAIAGAHLFISDCSATSIKRIAEEAEEEQWYTLDGRKLNGRPQIKGVYIRNGKKIYVSKK